MTSDPSPHSKTIAAAGPRPLRLWLEWTLLFVVFPVVMATANRPELFGKLLIVITLAGIGLLAITPGFRWRDLRAGGLVGDWRTVGVFTVATVAICTALVVWLMPERLLFLPREQTELWLKILVLYPLLSAVPQELFYRTLFFERYGALFPDHRWAIAVNAGCFGLAHLFYANGVAVILTTVGGGVFAWAYAEKRSFGLACVLHAIGGLIVFTSGLGLFFYHGAIGRM